MTTLEELFCKAKSAAEAAGKKTGELVEVTKLKMAAAEAEKEMAASFEGLGRLLFDSRTKGEDAAEAIDSCIAQIEEQQKALDALKADIDSRRKGTRCSECGTVNTDDSAFCKHCGKAL